MYNAQYLCVSCMEDFRYSLFSATSILLSDGEERDQRGELALCISTHSLVTTTHLVTNIMSTYDFHAASFIRHIRSSCGLKSPCEGIIFYVSCY